jgi:hypothetical protein
LKVNEVFGVTEGLNASKHSNLSVMESNKPINLIGKEVLYILCIVNPMFKHHKLLNSVSYFSHRRRSQGTNIPKQHYGINNVKKIYGVLKTNKPKKLMHNETEIQNQVDDKMKHEILKSNGSVDLNKALENLDKIDNKNHFEALLKHAQTAKGIEFLLGSKRRESLVAKFEVIFTSILIFRLQR